MFNIPFCQGEGQVNPNAKGNIEWLIINGFFLMQNFVSDEGALAIDRLPTP